MLSGFLTLLAYPPINLWPLAWFSFLPLLHSARSLNFWPAFRRGWWAGLIFNAGLLYWIALNSGAGPVLAALSFLGMLLVFPLYWALFTALWAYLYRRWGALGALLLPAIWVGLEVIKNAPEIGFPWQELGLTQINFLPAAQLAEWGGIRFVSAWVMGANVALFLILEKRRRVAYVCLTVLALMTIGGAWRLYHLPPATQELSVLLVQGNVDPAAKWRESADTSFAVYESLTREALKGSRADLVLWPETAIPSYLSYQQAEQNRLRHLAQELGAPILTGAPHYELRPGGGYYRYNSAFFFPADGSSPQRYDKMRLVPFGERVPFQQWFPGLGELNLGQAEFTAGKSYAVFKLENGAKIAGQICFESVFGEETRQFVRRGARVLCNLTNDGWYGNSSGPYQHAALVRYSAIETRCPLVRAANTGISLSTDRAGRVQASIPFGRRGAQIITVEYAASGLTFYGRNGELIPQWLLVIGGLGIAITLFSRQRKK